MSSKNSKKSDDKNDKEEEQALKEVEIVAELAPDEKTKERSRTTNRDGREHKTVLKFLIHIRKVS